MKFYSKIGLEVHIQLNTKSKIFSKSSTTYNTKPNINISLTDMAIPGTLPILNKNTINMALKFGIAVQGKILPISIFDRKNYFYPDLPKGYQISQFYFPIIKNGHIYIYNKNKKKIINIDRAHLEEDAGKLSHKHNRTEIDFNRAGIPLLEIVSKPDINSAIEAKKYLKTLHNIVCHINICDGKLQEGSFRCDVNISLKKNDDKTLGTKVEIKNINSFKFVENAINYEIKRQTNLLKKGKKITQETRLYDTTKNKTYTMRSKEDSKDYRYFPDPDLLPIKISKKYINKIKHKIINSSNQTKMSLINKYLLSETEVKIIINNKILLKYFLYIIKKFNKPKIITNWLIVDLITLLKKYKINKITPEYLYLLLLKINKKHISTKTAKKIFYITFKKKFNNINYIIKKYDLEQINNNKTIKNIINKTLTNYKQQMIQYKQGKKKLYQFFFGKIMEKTKNKTNPKKIIFNLNKIL
ncbi:MAG: Asp-tRNA(Asn)/Glu-tRNA(Gln) amidotransferase subunit GatB [Candidatus Azosocius agrarius]|nr:MAG: Asp-tRNA(Asn)/Glu-tRNA(Gln) amidotransferase subunit GatB [Gammaproteobacteria bacterium]